jgi:hypothetical protein
VSYTYVSTSTTTFTITHARQVASKVGADLKRLQDFYVAPSEDHMVDLETEIAVLIKHDVLEQNPATSSAPETIPVACLGASTCQALFFILIWNTIPAGFPI